MIPKSASVWNSACHNGFSESFLIQEGALGGPFLNLLTKLDSRVSVAIWWQRPIGETSSDTISEKSFILQFITFCT